MDCRTKAGLWWASVPPGRQHTATILSRATWLWEANKEGPSLVAGSKVTNPAWRQLCALAKNLSATCADPVDLEDSYYDHACLDPGSADADALSPDKMITWERRRLACCRYPAFEENCRFISSIYCQLIKHKKDYTNRPHTEAYTHPYVHTMLSGFHYW